MKTLSACTIAIAATLLLSLFTIPERAYAQQLPCGLSAWPTGSFTLYVTESAQFNTFGFSVSTLLDQTNYSEQGTGQAVMPALSLNGGSYTSSAQTTGTGSASLTYETTVNTSGGGFNDVTLVGSATGPFLPNPTFLPNGNELPEATLNINPSNCTFYIIFYYILAGSEQTVVDYTTIETIPTDFYGNESFALNFPCFQQVSPFSGQTSGQVSCGFGGGVPGSYNFSWSLSPTTSSCTNPPMPSSTFYQGAAKPAVPSNSAVIAYPANPTMPVPQYFGLLPSLAPLSLCPTIKSGCALSSAATMLTTFPNLINTTSLDSEIKAADGYDNGWSHLCPLNNPTCNSSMLIPYHDTCEMSWFAPQLVAPDAVDWIDGQEVSNNQLSDSGASVTVNQYLNDHVCGHQDRVILQLSESIAGVSSGPHYHYIYVEGQNGSDWNVFDPGWQNVTSGTSSTLSGHIAGFTANGSTRQFTVAGVRTYRDVTSTGNTSAFAVTANSPVELLVVDPQGRQLGNLDGTDVFQIPLGSYIRDFPLLDPLGTDIANGDPTGIKTAHVSSPLDGTSSVTATGTGCGTYTLTFRSLGSNGTVQTSSVTGPTNTGSTTIYQFSVSSLSGLSGVSIVSENGVSVVPSPLPGAACNGIYNGTFKGNITVSSGQTCTFVSGGV